VRFLYFLVPTALLALLLRAGCIYHMPMAIENDTPQAVLMDITVRAYPWPVRLEEIKPQRFMNSRHCWKKNDAILLATKQHPDPIVFDPKDFCDGLCQCDFPVSRLLKQMTPGFTLKRQQEVCGGGGPFLQPDVRKQLCEAYVARATGNSLSSGPDPAMLAR
jgi:hypothetical protein